MNQGSVVPAGPPGLRARLKAILTLVFYALVAVFLLRYLQNIRFEVLFEARWNFGWLAAAIGLGIAHKFLYPRVWRAILTGMGARIRDERTLYRVYAASWIGRYVPGKIAMVGARVLYAQQLGIQRSQAAISFVVEMGIQMLVWGTASLLAFAFAGHTILPERVPGWAALAPLVFLVFLYPPLLNLLIGWLFRLLRQDAAGVFLNFRTVFHAAALHLLIFLAYGCYNFSLVAAVLPDPMAQVGFAYVLAVFGFSLLLGMLAIFAPAGLGAREAVQLALLGVMVGPEASLLIVVLHRVVDLSADLVFWLSCTVGLARGESL